MTYGVDKELRTVMEVPPYLTGLAQRALPRLDFADAFAISLPLEANLDFTHVAIVGWQACPGWVHRAMQIRDALVGRVGLKTGLKTGPMTVKPVEADALINLEGDEMERALRALNPQFSADGDEMLVGMDDMHLDFRVSLLRQRDASATRFTVTTLVQFRNWLGRAYFVPVGIGHKWVVRAMMRALRERLVAECTTDPHDSQGALGFSGGVR